MDLESYVAKLSQNQALLSILDAHINNNTLDLNTLGTFDIDIDDTLYEIYGSNSLFQQWLETKVKAQHALNCLKNEFYFKKLSTDLVISVDLPTGHHSEDREWYYNNLINLILRGITICCILSKLEKSALPKSTCQYCNGELPGEDQPCLVCGDDTRQVETSNDLSVNEPEGDRARLCGYCDNRLSISDSVCPVCEGAATDTDTRDANANNHESNDAEAMSDVTPDNAHSQLEPPDASHSNRIEGRGDGDGSSAEEPCSLPQPQGGSAAQSLADSNEGEYVDKPPAVGLCDSVERRDNRMTSPGTASRDRSDSETAKDVNADEREGSDTSPGISAYCSARGVEGRSINTSESNGRPVTPGNEDANHRGLESFIGESHIQSQASTHQSDHLHIEHRNCGGKHSNGLELSLNNNDTIVTPLDAERRARNHGGDDSFSNAESAETNPPYKFSAPGASCGDGDDTHTIGQSYRSTSESVDLSVTADRTQATNPDSSSWNARNERPSSIYIGISSIRDPSPTHDSPRDRDQGSVINSETRASAAAQGRGTLCARTHSDDGSSLRTSIDHNNNGITMANHGNDKSGCEDSRDMQSAGVTVARVASVTRQLCEICDLEMPVEAIKCPTCNSVSTPTSTTNSLSNYIDKSSYNKTAPTIDSFGASRSANEEPENDNQATPGDLGDSPSAAVKKVVLQSPEWYCKHCGWFNALEATKCATCTAESTPTSTTNSLSSHKDKPVSPPPPPPPSSNKTAEDDGGSPGTAEKRAIVQSPGWHCKHCDCDNKVEAECCTTCDKAAPTVTTWNCTKCTYKNDRLSYICKVCETESEDHWVCTCGKRINTRFGEVCDGCYERNVGSSAMEVEDGVCSGEHVEGERGSRNSFLGDSGNEDITRWYVDEFGGDSPCVTSDGAGIEGGHRSARIVVAEREDCVSIDLGKQPDISADDNAIVAVYYHKGSATKAPIDPDTVE